MATPVTSEDLAGAERLLGRPLAARDLAEIALDPTRRGFSRLEFVGDAVLNLTLFTAGEVTGVSRPRLQQVVGNDVLDEVITASAIASPRRSGDVLEALVGAVHLGSDFDTAWSAALTLVAAHVGMEPTMSPPPLPTAVEPPARGRSFIGSAVLKAVVADHLCRSQPHASHHTYSRERAAVLTTANLASLWRAGSESGDERSPDDVASDRLEAAVAMSFLTKGWVVASEKVRQLLALTD